MYDGSEIRRPRGQDAGGQPPPASTAGGIPIPRPPGPAYRVGDRITSLDGPDWVEVTRRAWADQDSTDWVEVAERAWGASPDSQPCLATAEPQGTDWYEITRLAWADDGLLFAELRHSVDPACAGPRLAIR